MTTKLSPAVAPNAVGDHRPTSTPKLYPAVSGTAGPVAPNPAAGGGGKRG